VASSPRGPGVYGTWLLALLYERKKLFDSFGIEFCTGRGANGGTEIGCCQRKFDENRIAIDHQETRRLERRVPGRIVPRNQLKSPAKQGVGWFSDLNQLRINRCI
jgi:hypothetical protein